MKVHKNDPFVVLLSVFFFAVSAQAQTSSPNPAIVIGNHTLTLGLPESMVLEQLGTDLHLSKYRSSCWMLSKKLTSDFVVIGSVCFEDHKLSVASRSIEIEDPSNKSFFYAISSTIHDLEKDGLTSCTVSTSNASQPQESPTGESSGSVDSSQVRIDCGIKFIDISLLRTDVDGMVPVSITVHEVLLSKHVARPQ